MTRHCLRPCPPTSPPTSPSMRLSSCSRWVGGAGRAHARASASVLLRLRPGQGACIVTDRRGCLRSLERLDWPGPGKAGHRSLCSPSLRVGKEAEHLEQDALPRTACAATAAEPRTTPCLPPNPLASRCWARCTTLATTAPRCLTTSPTPSRTATTTWRPSRRPWARCALPRLWLVLWQGRGQEAHQQATTNQLTDGPTGWLPLRSPRRWAPLPSLTTSAPTCL